MAQVRRFMMNIFDMFSFIIGLFCAVCGLSYLFLAYFITKNEKSKKMYKLTGWILLIFGTIFGFEPFFL